MLGMDEHNKYRFLLHITAVVTLPQLSVCHIARCEQSHPYPLNQPKEGYTLAKPPGKKLSLQHTAAAK